MEEDDPTTPKPPRPRKPRAKTGTRASDAKGATANGATPRAKRTPAPEEGAATASATARSGSNGSPEPAPRFDQLIADEGFVRDFDRITSSNPRSAVFTALAVGVALGFFAALILSRD
jgi:hypothetical protein